MYIYIYHKGYLFRGQSYGLPIEPFQGEGKGEREHEYLYIYVYIDSNISTTYHMCIWDYFMLSLLMPITQYYSWAGPGPGPWIIINNSSIYIYRYRYFILAFHVFDIYIYIYIYIFSHIYVYIYIFFFSTFLPVRLTGKFGLAGCRRTPPGRSWKSTSRSHPGSTSRAPKGSRQ